MWNYYIGFPYEQYLPVPTDIYGTITQGFPYEQYLPVPVPETSNLAAHTKFGTAVYDTHTLRSMRPYLLATAVGARVDIQLHSARACIDQARG